MYSWYNPRKVRSQITRKTVLIVWQPKKTQTTCLATMTCYNLQVKACLAFIWTTLWLYSDLSVWVFFFLFIFTFLSYKNKKGADHPAHPHNLFSADVVRCLERTLGEHDQSNFQYSSYICKSPITSEKDFLRQGLRNQKRHTFEYLSYIVYVHLVLVNGISMVPMTCLKKKIICMTCFFISFTSVLQVG